jgi:hypothetical protein
VSDHEPDFWLPNHGPDAGRVYVNDELLPRPRATPGTKPRADRPDRIPPNADKEWLWFFGIIAALVAFVEVLSLITHLF